MSRLLHLNLVVWFMHLADRYLRSKPLVKDELLVFITGYMRNPLSFPAKAGFTHWRLTVHVTS